jgi:hypothetical protein
VVYARDPAKPITLPPTYIVAQLEASIAEGTEHEITIRLVDEDEQAVADPIKLGKVVFTPRGKGRPLGARIIAQFMNLTLPRVGDYLFKIDVNGIVVGELVLMVVEHVHPGS